MKRWLYSSQSMSRKAYFLDNAVAESCFKTLKTDGVFGNKIEEPKRDCQGNSCIHPGVPEQRTAAFQLSYRTLLQMV